MTSEYKNEADHRITTETASFGELLIRDFAIHFLDAFLAGLGC